MTAKDKKMEIEDYLTQEEMKDIATEEFKKLLFSDKQKERLLTNMSYNLGYGIVKEIITDEELESVKNRTKDLMLNDKMALRNAIYQKPDIWNMKRDSDLIVYNEIQKAIKENIEVVRSKVVSELENMDLDKFQEEFDIGVIFEMLLKNIKR